MKKLIKRKLFYSNTGSYKNFFLWEISSERGPVYEIVEEFKGRSIARAMLRGIYRDRIKALSDFRKVIMAELTPQSASLSKRLAFN